MTGPEDRDDGTQQRIDRESDEPGEFSALLVREESPEQAELPEVTELAEPDEHDEERGGPAEWRWVQEWRASGEPVPWPQGIALGAFTLLIVASSIFVLTAGVADTPWLAVVLNLVVAGGIGPQLWLARGIPVIRFVSWGAALGVPVGWLACLVVPFPT